MPKLELTCPSCGAKVPFESSIALLAVCAYCRGLLMRQDLNLQELCKVAQLQADGSPLQLGARGIYNQAFFTLRGRLQMRYPQGFWNEWFLEFEDGRQGWLGEAQGVYAVSFSAAQKTAPPAYDVLAIGQELTLDDGNRYAVRDKHAASYGSAEGALPFQVPFDVEAPLADLSGPGRLFATIDYGEDRPLVFTGEYREFDELAFEGLKVIEGW